MRTEVAAEGPPEDTEPGEDALAEALLWIFVGLVGCYIKGVLGCVRERDWV